MENSIEENIEILEKFKNNEMQRDKLERDGRCGGWKIGDIYKCLELDNAIDNILSDYKRVLKENEELHKEIDRMKSLDIYKLVEDWETGQLIPIQKIKDKIEELSKTKGDLATHIAVSERIRALQEILESEDSKDGEN